MTGREIEAYDFQYVYLGAALTVGFWFCVWLKRGDLYFA